MSVLYISVTVHRHVFCLLGFIHCQFSWFCSDMDSGPLFLSNSLSSLSDVRLPNVLCQLFPRSSVFSTLYQEFSLGLYPCLVLSCLVSCLVSIISCVSCLLSFISLVLSLVSFVFYLLGCVFCSLSCLCCCLLPFVSCHVCLAFCLCQVSYLKCLVSFLLSYVFSLLSFFFYLLSIVFSLLSFVFYLLPIVLSCVFCILSIFASFVLESLYFYRSRFDCISLRD